MGFDLALIALARWGRFVALSLFENVGLLAAIEVVPPIENRYPGQVGKRVGVESPEERQNQGGPFHPVVPNGPSPVEGQRPARYLRGSVRSAVASVWQRLPPL
jgi:hypothetical protein